MSYHKIYDINICNGFVECFSFHHQQQQTELLVVGLKMIKGEKSRKTLVQLQSECGVKDPAHQAKLAVSELDKTAKNSQAKRKKCIDQIDSDQHEIDHIDHQIAQIKERYDPLCAGLKEKEEQKKMMIKVLERCVADNHTVSILHFTFAC